MRCENVSIGPNGTLFFAGQDTVELAKIYGTPLYLMDEDRVRQNCRNFQSALRASFGPAAKALYASKANAFKGIYRIMAEEDMGVDVVSIGELFTAKSAGYDLSNAYFHGNNKTDNDLAFALKEGIGYFVVDNPEELHALETAAARHNLRQKILLRLTPGIDPHTYAAVSTGQVDSKFGAPIPTGQAEAITLEALDCKHLDLVGFHCHVGSQVFGEDVFVRAAETMLDFAAHMKRAQNFEIQELDLGGGYGVPYLVSDPVLDLQTKLSQLFAACQAACDRLNIPIPAIRVEPGRAIVADAGLTLYTVGSVKKIPGYKVYVSVDGGMTDNPRYALYKAPYTCLPANKMTEPFTMECSLAGRCCESGDMIQEKILLPESMARGDLIAVCTTGAYNYSMSSNYNKLPRPPIVMLSHGTHSLAVRRESLEDLIRNEL